MMIIRFSWERLTQIADGELVNVGLNFSRFAYYQWHSSFNNLPQALQLDLLETVAYANSAVSPFTAGASNEKNWQP